MRWSGQLADAEGKPSKTFQEETEQVVVVGREGEAQAWWGALLPTCKQAEVAEVTVQPSRGSAADLRTPPLLPVLPSTSAAYLPLGMARRGRRGLGCRRTPRCC